jgi:membrane associated rhomboid family serine protease
MTPTPVGMRCPECANERTKVTRGAVAPSHHDAPATYILIALNVVAYLAEIAGGGGGLSPGSSSVLIDFGLFGPSVAEGEWYRLLTSGFLHASIFHIGFNMFALYFLGRILEPGIGTPRFVALYFASLLAGSFGALLLDPNALTIGASGAVFGIFGATFVIARSRGVDALASSVGIILVLNLAITFGRPEISIGGHLGGLAAGLLCALIIVAGDRGRLGPRRLPIELLAMIAIAVFSVVAAIVVA